MVVEVNTSSLLRLNTSPNRSGIEKDELVSIIIPAYLMADFIPQALLSVEKQTYAHWEIIVVDDAGPEDGTCDIVTNFASRNADHRIDYIRHEINRGVSASRNTAIRHARGSILAFLDPDDYWETHHLDLLLRMLTAERSTAVNSLSRVIRIGVSARGRVMHGATEEEVRNFPATLGYRNFILPSATLVRRDAVEAIGGFDESPEIQHAEDYDLWIRLLQDGACFCFVRNITCNYRKHPDAATIDMKKDRQRREVVYGKHVNFFVHSLRKLLELEHEERKRDRAKAPGSRVKAVFVSMLPDWIKKIIQRRSTDWSDTQSF